MQNNPYEAPVAEGGGVAGPLATGRYEFSEAENKQIGETGRRSWMWGVIALVTGLLGMIGLVIAFAYRSTLAQSGLDSNWITIFIVALLPLVAVNLAIGAFYMGAGNSMKAVVKTQGADVEHMMRSLNKLGTAFFIEFMVGTVTVVGGFCAGVALAVYQPEFLEGVENGDVESGDDDD